MFSKGVFYDIIAYRAFRMALEKFKNELSILKIFTDSSICLRGFLCLVK